MFQEFNYVCSLGFNCHPAGLLKRNGLKPVSYPCDWIMSSLKNLKHFIVDDFQLFLDKSQYIYITPNKCGHTFYAPNMFWHKSPLTSMEDYEYYVRCVERFRQLLKTDKNKLFLMMVINGQHGIGDKMSDEIKNSFIEFNNLLKGFTDENNYKLLIIINYPNKERNSVNVTSVDNIDIIEVDTLSCSNGLKFINEQDNIYVDNIIKLRYTFDLLDKE